MTLLIWAFQLIPLHLSATITTAATTYAGEQSDKEKSPPPASPTVTNHRVTVAGREISYTAAAGELPIKNDAGETEANIFFVSYTAEKTPTKNRPIIFVFNGGPGAASVWLHLGCAGPRRVQMLSDGKMPQPPFKLVDNDFTWLDLADLVFIDPVGTGYSRAVKPDMTKKFKSVQGDIDSVGRFIRLYLTQYGRWGSPLFLAGESYGTFRAAGLADYLLEHGMALNGIIMISTVMNFQDITFAAGNELPYLLFLPSYTATAWYHQRLMPELQVDLDKTLAAVESWAEGGYLMALAKGDRLSPEERKGVAAKLAQFTGLNISYIDNRNLRIDNNSFARELLRDRREVVGSMDSRFTAPNLDPAVPYGFDPTVANIRPPFTAAVNGYIRNELGYHSDLEYLTLGEGTGSWEWDTRNGFADTSENLRNAFAKNRYMKLFIASGLFDLATPYLTTDYTLSHLGLTPALRRNVTTRRYRSGHMIYLDNAAIAQLKRDISAFIEAALPPR
ncbi:MAG TPA: peptidase S10 [Geobacteraceae bacterium]|nr:peptidase S10 [Geobacteraceae bacterium]